MAKIAATLSVKELNKRLKDLETAAQGNPQKNFDTVFVGGCSGGYVEVKYKRDNTGKLSQVTRMWKVKFIRNGKQTLTTLGRYENLSLADFRDKVNDMRKKAATGVDVIAERKAERNDIFTFADVCNEWLLQKVAKSGFSEKYAFSMRQRVLTYILPKIGKEPIKELSRKVAIDFLQSMERQGHFETFRRIAGICRRICSYAVAREYMPVNPFTDLNEIFSFVDKNAQNYPTLTDPSAIGDLMRKVYAYKDISLVLWGECLFSIFTLARQNEARHCRWEQLDFNKRIWTISAADMKSRREHIVPLSSGALQVLEEMRAFQKWSEFVFPSPRSGRPLSDNACRIMLRALGYTNEQLVPHGFRAMASTQLNELNYPRDWIDVSLAHTVGNSVSQAYNHSTLLENRRGMLEAYYNYLTALREGMEPEQAMGKFKFSM